MRRYARLYGYFLLQRFKILMEYRANFLIGICSTLILQGAGLLAVWVVMRRVPSLNGWSYDEVLLMFGLITLTRSLSHMFADNLWTIGRQYIQTGGFDRFLVRPIDPLFHLLADRFCQDGIGHFLIGIALLIKSTLDLRIVWTPLSVLYLLVALLSGGAIFIALNLITAVSAFWIVDSTPVTRSIFETHEFAKYPLAIYDSWISWTMTWIIPYGFASYYPASYILGRTSTGLVWAPPLVAVILLLIGYRLWRVGLRHYTSTGS